MEPNAKEGFELELQQIEELEGKVAADDGGETVLPLPLFGHGHCH